MRYFHAIVREGTLTGAAEVLNLSQSALSMQLKKLEESLGTALFSREHKSLRLTEEGKMVFDYVETIFQAGEEMLATLQNRQGRYREVIRVGAVATLSRNFQLSFLEKLLHDVNVEVIIHSASLRELLNSLGAHTLDFVLSNTEVRRDPETPFQSHKVAEQKVSLVGPKTYRKRGGFQFPEGLKGIPLVLPSLQSNIRSVFDLIMDRAGFRPLIAAEVDDMAMMRLLAREMDALTLVPEVVVKDELKSGELSIIHSIPNLTERFYAITTARRYPNPYLKVLLEG